MFQLVLHDSHSVICLNAPQSGVGWGGCNGSAPVPVVLIIEAPAMCHNELVAV